MKGLEPLIEILEGHYRQWLQFFNAAQKTSIAVTRCLHKVEE
jgi:hypothetical protein